MCQDCEMSCTLQQQQQWILLLNCFYYESCIILRTMSHMPRLRYGLTIHSTLWTYILFTLCSSLNTCYFICRFERWWETQNSMLILFFSPITSKTNFIYIPSNSSSAPYLAHGHNFCLMSSCHSVRFPRPLGEGLASILYTLPRGNSYLLLRDDLSHYSRGIIHNAK